MVRRVGESLTMAALRSADGRAAQGLGLQRAFQPLGRCVPPRATDRARLVSDAWCPSIAQAWSAARGGSDERGFEIVLVVDHSPSMWLWSSAVREFARALTAAGVFRDVTVRRWGVAADGRMALWGAEPGSPCRGVGELLAPSAGRLVLVVTDVVDDGWRSGRMGAVLRQWAAVHPVAVASPVPWESANRSGLELHRIRLAADRPAAANADLWWRPRVDVPGVLDDLDDLVPIPFLRWTEADLRRWSELVAGVPDRIDLGAMLLSGIPPPVDEVRPGAVDPVELVADYRAEASREGFALAVSLAAAPLEVALAERIRQRMFPATGPGLLSEFLASPLVRPVPSVPGTPGSRALFDFVAPGLRAELLGFGGRLETVLVRDVVGRYLAETGGAAAVFEATLDAEATVADHDLMIDEHVFRAELAGQGALALAHLRNYRVLSSGYPGAGSGTSASPLRSDVDHTSVAAQSDGPSRTRVRTKTEDVTGNAGGVEVTSAVDREKGVRGKGLTAPVFGGVPPRNPNFTGRADLLQELERRLVRGATAAVLPEALHGMGGVGKSQLAIEYAYRNRTKFDLIWWIPAERSVKIVNSLVELGERLELNVGTEANVAVRQVLDVLKSGRHPKVPQNWLLVFDNADSPSGVQQYLPTGGSGRILVTSRNSQWLSVARPLEVDVFRRSESTQLLRRRDPDLTEQDAGRLAEALGDLPLAIAQAAAWRVETGMSANEYLELLEEKQLELLDVTTTLDYPRSVAAMWNLSINQLRRKNPSAVRLLQVCAFLAPESIARTMFTNSRNIDVNPELAHVLRDRLRLTEAIRDINRFALVRIDHRTNSIEMHRLVQSVLISQMTDEEVVDLRHAAHLMLAANDPDLPGEPTEWGKYADLSAHLSASDAFECEDAAVRTLVFNQVMFLYFWGEHDKAAAQSQKIYEIWRDRLGAEHADTLKLGIWYGFMLWSVGRYGESASLNLELLEAHRLKYGEAHEETIEAIGSVAGDYRAKGDFAAALELSVRNHDNCVRYFGDEDPVTLNAAHNLGVSYRLAGDFLAARDLDRDTWGRKVQIFGQDHLLTLLTEMGLTIDLRETGDYHEARIQHEGVVRAYERHGRPLHPSWLRAVRQLAIMRRKAGDHEGALQAADTALEGLTTRYGSNHSETLAAALCRSIELRHLGRFGKASQLGQDTLTRFARTLGPDHPHTLAAAVNVAILRRSVGEAEGACDLDQATLAGFRARLGEDHPSTLITGINLASDLFALGEVQRAFDLDDDLLRRTTAVLGEDHPTVLACTANLARDHKALGRTEEAERLQRRAVDTWRHNLGVEHPAVAQLEDMSVRANCDIDPLPL
ncbi:FxSxx-COOH system tetratricopeptide repeat protein [Saccharothrix espanaensis]|nr:FxSxx-COOH system tetratricopeptide repeat protein [Saccharothrix espanaensis]